ncbi:HAD-superfamily hydrolase, subfamily IA, variant 3 [Treponema primitia ZAS-2]|uniref:HAD-superfamily hydrolase, subfamily IA, variant 3 n=1 Tax=Treponema primitia (strain ATCC BAA-887 / DSM 12427 / ZAS-2) TaxID=545694 RepID=F5YL25_TREPZ|nr:HAD family phosphatase [Treponema primitia]AEF85939.1 HAD-superfamily hydrolase, subfamily IA, variant 3 [Treponema primitia ZAS-2]
MSIKGVAFDFGNVISLPQDTGVIDELVAIAGMERPRFEPLLWAARGEYDRGTLTGIEYYRGFLAKAGVFPAETALEQMVAIDLKSWSRINPETVKLMEDVKNAGLKLGILSNMPHEFLAMARKNIPVFQLPHRGIFSCEVDSIKPEEKIYRETLSALGLEPEEMAFFDDIAVNVDKARSLGIQAFIWKDSKTARADLETLSVTLGASKN